MKSNYLVLVLTTFVLLPKVGVLDFSMLFIFFIACCSYLKNNHITPLKINKVFFIITFVWICLFCLALFSFLYHGSYSTALLLKPVRQITIFLSLYILFFYSQINKDDILKVFLFAGALNSIVVVVQYVTGITIPGNTGDFLMHPDYDRDINLAWRKPGLMVGFPHASFMSCFGVLCGLYLLRHKYTKVVFLSFFACFIALFLSARSGMMLGIFGILILLPFFVISSRKNFLTIILFISSIVCCFYYLIVNELIPVDTFEMMFEVFINIMNGNNEISSSQTALFESFKYPLSHISTLLIGNGLQHHADNLLNVDAGFQQYLFGGGIFYLISTYILYFYTAYISVKYHFHTNFYFVTVFLMFLFLLIGSLKGGFIFSRGPSDLLIIIFVFSLVSNKRGGNEFIR